jgi:hypothetical protein
MHMTSEIIAWIEAQAKESRVTPVGVKLRTITLYCSELGTKLKVGVISWCRRSKLLSSILNFVNGIFCMQE